MHRRHILLGLLGIVFLTGLAWLGGVRLRVDDWREKRVHVVIPGQLIRGAWQRPGPMRRIIGREGVRTIVTLTAINANDPKFIDQRQVVKETGVSWFIVPMRGSRGTPEQMALAADLLADPGRQPVYFHCVAGHHRTSLAHAAYLIRHRGYSAQQAWEAISSLSWARPDSPVDRNDRFLIEEFARVQGSLAPATGRGIWEISHGQGGQQAVEVDPAARAPSAPVAWPAGGPQPGPPQLRGASAREDLPVRPDDRHGPEEDDS